MMKIGRYLKKAILGLFFGTLLIGIGEPTTAKENLFLFDADGRITATYDIGLPGQKSWTLSVGLAGSDLDVIYETFGQDPTLPSSPQHALVPMEGHFAVPNELKGTWSTLPPPSGIPEVSLYGFNEAMRDENNISTPGIKCTPLSGNYDKTISVTLSASPGSASVHYRYQGETAWWNSSTPQVRLFVYKDTVLEVKAVDGSYESEIAVMTYTISRPPQTNPEMVDSDNDGYPDCWEIKHLAYGLDPLKLDNTRDSDGDGIYDVDEILRGSDPGQAGSIPVDSDHDGWSDFDEDLRGTDPGNHHVFPTARRLYEVERKLTGTVYQDNTGTNAIAQMPFTIISLDTIILAQGSTNAGGVYGDIRIPVGEPAIFRGQGEPHANFIVKQYIPFTDDLTPTDIATDWESAEAWEQLYIQMLQDRLVEDVSGFNIFPKHLYPLALFERQVEILAQLEGVYFLAGSLEYPFNTTALKLLNDTLALRGQTFNDHIEDLQSLLDQAQICIQFLDDSDAVYAACTGGDAKTVEMQMADMYQQAAGRYFAGLMLDYNFTQINQMVYPMCHILDPDMDLDSDGVVNGSEVSGVLTGGRHFDPLNPDTDGDGILDNQDNCPFTENPDQLDFDGDGIGDVCDPDDDNDGLSDGLESVFGSSPFAMDTDNDGITDLEAYEAFMNPGLTVTIDLVISPANSSSQTLSGTMEENGIISLTVDTGAVPGPVSYPDSQTWTCTITGFSQGLNTITATVSDGMGGQGQATAFIIVDTIPPVAAITSPSAGPTSENTPVLTYTVDEGQVTVKVDNAVVNRVSGQMLDLLSDGLHTIRVESIDTAGNIGFDEVQITVVTQYSSVVNVQAGEDIQDAIDSSNHGTKIIVGQGTYIGQIDFTGKAIWIVSEKGPKTTILDGGGLQSVVVFNSNETHLSILEGFTIQNGFSGQGAGIFCSNGSPLIKNNRIVNNNATLSSEGGGIFCGTNAHPVIVNNLIAHNTASDYGGGIFVKADAGPDILNNTLDDNWALSGGGIYCELDAWPVIVNNIIVNSPAGGGVWTQDTQPDIDYNNTWNNFLNSMEDNFPGVASSGSNGISLNPEFVNLSLNDYHLKSESPCIDAGNNNVQNLPDTDQDDKSRILDGDLDQLAVVDMGAFEYGNICRADIDGDGDIDGTDLVEFSNAYGTDIQDIHYNPDADFDGNDIIDINDLMDFAADYGRSICHNQP